MSPSAAPVSASEMLASGPRAVLTVWTRAGGCCQLCGLPVTPDDASIDHIRPLSRGGAHAVANFQLAHSDCNTRKGSRLATRISGPLRGV